MQKAVIPKDMTVDCYMGNMVVDCYNRPFNLLV